MSRSGLLGTEALALKDSPLNWVAEQLEAGTIPDAVTATFELDEIQQAHELLDSGRAGGKIVVTI